MCSQKFTGKHLCQSLFLIKFQPCNFNKTKTLAQVFFDEFSGTASLQNTSGRLFLLRLDQVIKSTQSKFANDIIVSRSQIFSFLVQFLSLFLSSYFVVFLIKTRKRYPLYESGCFAPTQLYFENFRIFVGLYITQLNIYDGAFIVKIVSR